MLSGDLAEQAFTYLFFLGPAFYVAGAFRAYRHLRAQAMLSASRRFVTIAGLLFLAASEAALLLFPDIIIRDRLTDLFSVR